MLGKHVCILTCLLILSTGCSNQKIIPEPVVVEVPVTKYVPVPPRLLVQYQKAELPETLNYGEALQLWAEDRATIDSLLGQIVAIETLTAPDPE